MIPSLQVLGVVFQTASKARAWGFAPHPSLACDAAGAPDERAVEHPLAELLERAAVHQGALRW